MDNSYQIICGFGPGELIERIKIKVTSIEISKSIAKEKISLNKLISEKETALRPHKELYSNGDTKFYCPRCGHYFAFALHGYCPQCGQHIDWEVLK